MTENAGRCSSVGRASDSRARDLGFDTRPGHILSFLLLLIQERQLSVTGKKAYAQRTGQLLRRSKPA